MNFKFYKSEDGLSSNTVHAVLQDSKGFMWFGTENGLNRFDGYKFTIYNNTPRDNNSLINNYVYTLIEDQKEVLWIGTERGVSLYDLNNKIRFIFIKNREWHTNNRKSSKNNQY